jgi:hypothetical protein
MSASITKKRIPTWMVGLVVLATGAATAYAMLKAGQPAPWISNKPYTFVPTPPFILPAPLATATGVIPVGGLAPARPVQILRADTIPAHGDRGLCINCHTITDSRGQPLPAIRATSVLTHAYRGVCMNCHGISPLPGQPAPTFGLQAATNAAAVAPRTPPEGEWLGIEVSPITQLTATQFKIPSGTPGLVIVEAEASGATVGLKPGDVIQAVNGNPIRSMTDFFQATQNGTLTSGTLEFVRSGQRMTVNVTVAPPATPPAAGQPAIGAVPTPTQPGALPPAPAAFQPPAQAALPPTIAGATQPGAQGAPPSLSVGWIPLVQQGNTTQPRSTY